MAESLAVAHQVCAQDVTTLASGAATLRDGVAAERRISVEDGEMRHGRKSRSLLVDGFKRHVLRDLDSGLIPVVGVTAANVPEASVTDSIEADLAAQKLTVGEWHIDRGYLASRVVKERSAEVEIYCKAWPVRMGRILPRRRFIWTGSGRKSAVRTTWCCHLRWADWCSFQQQAVECARCASAARGVLRVGA